MPPLPTRYRAIDGFRFLAAMGIVLRHYTRYSENPFWDQLFTKNYLFVDLFFVISGFVITLAYGASLKTADDYTSFLQNRLARIYPLHFAVFLVFLAMDLAAASGLYHAREVHTFNLTEMASNLFLMQAWGFDERLSYNYPSWSISAEWMLYLLFPLVLAVMRRAGGVALLALGLAGIGLLEVLAGTGRLDKWTELTWHFGYFRAIPTFLIGAGLCCMVDRSALVFRSFAWPMVFFAGAIAGMALRLPDLAIIGLFVLTVASATGAERAGQPRVPDGQDHGPSGRLVLRAVYDPRHIRRGGGRHRRAAPPAPAWRFAGCLHPCLRGVVQRSRRARLLVF